MRKMLLTTLLFAVLVFWAGCGGSDASGDSSEDNSGDQAAMQEAERELTKAKQEAKEAKQQAEEARAEAEDAVQAESVEEGGDAQLSPTETLEIQWQFLNAGQYEESYNLFAEQSQQLISLEDYSNSYAPTYEITDYTFSSEDIRGETAIIEAELFLTGTQKGTQQYPITQELVLEDGEWRVVMRDAQAQALLEKQDSSTKQAEQDTQPEDPEEGNSSNVIIRVTGGESFSGNYGTLDSSRSIDGVAPAEYPVEVDTGLFSMDSVSAVMQKNGAGSGELGVEIVVDGEVVKETSTTAEYGVAQVSWMPGE